MSTFTIEVKEIELAAERLAGFDEQDLLTAQVKAVAEVADRAYDTNRRRMNAGINLDDAYITRRMTMSAVRTEGKTIRVDIVANGNLTVLGHYSPKIVTRAAPKAKGDPSRGISPGQKASGVTVEVTRGSRRTIPGGFILPLRKGTLSGGNGMSVFTRGADGRLRNRYGPSVYQLFRFALGETIDETSSDLENSVSDAIERELVKIL